MGGNEGHNGGREEGSGEDERTVLKQGMGRGKGQVVGYVTLEKACVKITSLAGKQLWCVCLMCSKTT